MADSTPTPALASIENEWAASIDSSPAAANIDWAQNIDPTSEPNNESTGVDWNNFAPSMDSVADKMAVVGMVDSIVAESNIAMARMAVDMKYLSVPEFEG